MTRASHKQVNVVNIGLMLFSCLLAYVLPLHLFLFSYAVLGPLHYLTEISWLQERAYFLRRRDYLLLAGLCVLVLFITVLNLNSWHAVILGAAFGSALALAFLRRAWHKILFIGAVLLLTFSLRHLPTFKVLFAVFLPTIIHTTIFTGLFILHGALKRRSISGYISLLVFIGCSVIFFLFNPSFTGMSVSNYVRESYRPVLGLNFYLAKLFGFSEIRQTGDLYLTQSGMAIMRFVAFAYTYHYLNWFSKTSVIKWHEVSSRRLGAIITLWVLFVGVYAYDYNLGIVLLLALALSHVILEFPLNQQTAWGVVKELKLRAWSKAFVKGRRLSSTELT